MSELDDLIKKHTKEAEERGLRRGLGVAAARARAGLRNAYVSRVDVGGRHPGAVLCITREARELVPCHAPFGHPWLEHRPRMVTHEGPIGDIIAQIIAGDIPTTC